MSSIGDRLREERERLGYSQPAFGAIGGKTKKTVMQWEGGEQFPNAAFLSSIAAQGADVQYILTGQSSAQALSPDEQELIAAFRAAPLAVKAAAIGALTAGVNTPGQAKVKQKISGAGHQVAGRDVVNHQGAEIDVQGKTTSRRK